MSSLEFDPELLQAGLLIGAGVLVALFLVYLALREFNCWYWKVNQRLALLAEIRNLLDRGQVRDEAQRRALAEAGREKRETACARCGARYPGDLAGQFCEKCGGR